MNNLIGISGKMGSGKDLLFDIIQYNVCRKVNPMYNKISFADFSNMIGADYIYENKKFANPIKEITCMLIGCTMKQLEDREFKEKPLGDEWNCWLEYPEQGYPLLTLNVPINPIEGYDEHRVMTPRLLLQLLGTEAGREVIHPNLWINALFSSYNKSKKWIITDVRFKNEADAIKKNGGMLIRIDRPNLNLSKHEHFSETALDHYTDWDLVIQNDGTVVELFNKISKFI